MVDVHNGRTLQRRHVTAGLVSILLGAAPLPAEVLNVPGEYPTIQQAIDAANDADEIVVAAGAYYELIDFLGKAIIVRSAEGPAVTTIDGYGLGTVVTCAGYERPETVLEGFTITGGGHGLLVEYSSPTVLECIFEDNAGSGIRCIAGAPAAVGCQFIENGESGMYNLASSPILIDCVFAANTGSSGGGVFNSTFTNAEFVDCLFVDNAAGSGGGMGNYHRSDANLSNCVFSGNVALTGRGGGMRNYDHSSPTLADCQCNANTAESGGGLANGEFCSPTLISCVFSENEAEYYGGAISNEDDCSPVLTDCVFQGNAADDEGGCIYNRPFCNPRLTGCTLSGNSAREGGAILSRTGSSPTLIDCVFADNTATSGGGLYTRSNSNPRLLGCTFLRNEANLGIALHNEDCSATLQGCRFIGNVGSGGVVFNYYADSMITNCVFAGNAVSERGAGVYNRFDSQLIATNCTFAANEAQEGSGIYNYGSASSIVTGCVFWGNNGEVIAGDGEATVTYSNVESADPLFVRSPDPGPDGIWGTADDDYGDLRILGGSPCIDAGDNTAVPADEFDLDEDGDTAEPIPYDLDGKPRFVDDPDTEDTGNGEPPIVDMGASEYQANPCPGDFDHDGDVDTADLLFLLGAWGTPDGDVDGDGDTDTSDLLALLAAWGECPESYEETCAKSMR